MGGKVKMQRLILLSRKDAADLLKLLKHYTSEYENSEAENLIAAIKRGGYFGEGAPFLPAIADVPSEFQSHIYCLRERLFTSLTGALGDKL
jgi:hypothetical protein